MISLTIISPCTLSTGDVRAFLARMQSIKGGTVWRQDFREGALWGHAPGHGTCQDADTSGQPASKRARVDSAGASITCGIDDAGQGGFAEGGEKGGGKVGKGGKAEALAEGDLVECEDMGSYYAARILETQTFGPAHKHLVKVHFTGWRERFDHWVPCSSPRLSRASINCAALDVPRHRKGAATRKQVPADEMRLVRLERAHFLANPDAQPEPGPPIIGAITSKVPLTPALPLSWGKNPDFGNKS
ncbi:hypothetical protein T484DRAFT_2459733 [Baffinella frigidus]|nr:hypothetical protein T484DRAFT_2459733 [Cryptophyta sp. CCMP2293]